MAKGLDDLLRFLVRQVALKGEIGATPADIAQCTSKFYKNDITSTQSAAVCVDQPFHEQVWSWLIRHPDIRFNSDNSDVPDWTLSQVEAYNAQHIETLPIKDGDPDNAPPVQDVSKEPIRLLATEQQIWLALTGHGPDSRRVPPFEFACLSVIAAHGPAGIVQPLLVRLTGQDKRSLPDRTSRLAEKGYIVKRKVLFKGGATSLCILKQYAIDSAEAGDGAEQGDTPWSQHRFSGVESMIRESVEIIQDRKIVTWRDLRALLDIPVHTKIGKRILDALGRFEDLGCVERVWSCHGPEGKSKTEYRSFRSKRLATEDDWKSIFSFGRDNPKWNDMSQRDDEGMISENNGPEVHAENTDNDEDEVIAGSGDGPIWDPDRPLTNVCFDAIAKAGPAGLTTAEACELATGSFYLRSTSSLLFALGDTWLANRPMDLSVLRDAVFIRRKSLYKYYTFANFQAAVDEGTLSWEMVGRQKLEPEQYRESHLFTKLDPRIFVGSSGLATLGEAARPALLQAAKQPMKYRRQTFTPVQAKVELHAISEDEHPKEGVSRGTRIRTNQGVRKYAVSYTEEELNAMPFDKRKKILNSIAMGRNYHRKRHQERIDAEIARGLSFEDAVAVLYKDLEVAAQSTNDPGLLSRIDVLNEIALRHRNSLYLPSKAAHSTAHLIFSRETTALITRKPMTKKSKSVKTKAPTRKLRKTKSVVKDEDDAFDERMASPRNTRARRSGGPHNESSHNTPETEAFHVPTVSMKVIVPPRDITPIVEVSARLSQTSVLTTVFDTPEEADVMQVDTFAPQSPSVSRSGRIRRQTAKAQGLDGTRLLSTTKSVEQDGSLVTEKVSQGPYLNQSNSKLTYEQQLSHARYSTRLLTVGHTSRLANGGRGIGPRSLLLVFKNLDSSSMTRGQFNFRPGSPASTNLNGQVTISDERQALNSTPSPKLRTFQAVNRPEPLKTATHGVQWQGQEEAPPSDQTTSLDNDNTDFTERIPAVNRGLSAVTSIDLAAKERVDDNEHVTSLMEIDDPPAVTHRTNPNANAIASPVAVSKHVKVSNFRNTPVIMEGISRYGGGSAAAAKKDIIMKIIRDCDGVFPGGREMWYPFTSRWLQQGGKGRPDTRTVTSLVKQLINANRLRKITFNFEKARPTDVELVRVKDILVLPEISSDDPRILFLQDRMRDTYPRLYVPEEAGVSEHVRKNPESLLKSSHSQQPWAEKVFNAPATSLPMTATIVDAIRRGDANTPMDRLREWHKIEASRRRLVDQDDDESDDHRAGSDLDVSSSKAARARARAARQEVNGFPVTSKGGRIYKARQAVTAPVGQSVEPQTDQIAAQLDAQLTGSIRPATTALWQPPLNTASKDIDKQRRIERVAALSNRSSTSLAGAYRPFLNTIQSPLPVPSESLQSSLPRRYPLTVAQSQRKLPRLPKLQSSDDVRRMRIFDVWRPQSQADKSPAHQVSDRPLLDCEQSFFSGTGCFGTFLQIPVWFVPKSVEDILNRGWAGRLRPRHYSSIDSKFRWILSQIERWEQNDPSALHMQNSGYHFINIDPFTDPDPQPRAILKPRTRAPNQQHTNSERRFSDRMVPDRRIDRIENIKKRGAPANLSEQPRKRRRVQRSGYGPLNEDRDFMLAIAISKTLFQGGDERFTNWEVVVFLLGGALDAQNARRRWKSIRPIWSPWLASTRTWFESAYLDAYQNSRVPELNYQDLPSNDWQGLMSWAKANCGELSSVDCVELHPGSMLPASRTKLGSDVSLEVAPIESDVLDIKNKSTMTATRRRQLLHMLPIRLSEKPSSRKANDDLVSDDLVSLSWVRANILTPSTKYNALHASTKLRSVAELNIDDAVKRLLKNKLIVFHNSGQDTASRSYDVTEKFVTNLKANLDVKHFKEAAEFKFMLDAAFDQYGHAQLDYHAREGSIIALLDMLSAGTIKVEAEDVQTDFGEQGVSFYRTRTLDKTQLRFGMKLSPTHAYIKGNPLLPLPPKPRGVEQKSSYGVDKTPIPAWYDLNGDSIEGVWQYALSMLLGLLTIRPGLSMSTLKDFVQSSLEVWEIKLLVNWAVEAKMVKWQDETRSSLQLGRWWWMALG